MNRNLESLFEDLSKLKFAHTKTLIDKCNFYKKYILEECSLSDDIVENIYLISRGLKEIPKCLCGKCIKFIKYSKGYEQTCGDALCRNKLAKTNRERNNTEKYGVANVSNIKDVQDKRKQTFIDKYGVENPFQHEFFKDKIKQTNLEKYGCENINLNSDIREKIKKTNLEKYGCENPSQNEDIKHKKEETSLKNYGVKYHYMLDSEKIKLKQVFLERFGGHPLSLVEYKEKSKRTCLEKYGTEYSMQNEDVKTKSFNTNIEKYGFKSPMQNSKIQSKNRNSRFRKKLYIFPSKKEVLVQGYENFVLDLLLMRFTENDIICDSIEIEDVIGIILYKIENGSIHRYYPDIYIKSINKIIEVKSIYTYNKKRIANIAKMKACIEQGFNFDFYILDAKHNLVYLDENYNII